MVSITTAWGYTFRVPKSSKILVANGLNWEVYQRTTPTRIALAFNGTKTVRKVLRNEEHAQLVAWAEENAAKEKPPTPPPEPEEARVIIDSKPSGGKAYIDRKYTGFKTKTPSIKTTPGFHQIEVRGITGYVDTQIRKKLPKFTTSFVTVHMAPKPKPPTPPPPEPPPPEKPEETLARIIKEWGLDPAGSIGDFLTAYGRILDWITDVFGMEIPQFARNAVTGKIEQLPTGKKVILWVSMKAPVTVAEKAIAGALGTMTAGEIQAMGLKDPKGLASMFKALSKENTAKLFNALVRTPAGKKAIEVIQRVVLDQRTGIAKWKIMGTLVGAGATLFGLAHTLNFLGFLGEETIQTRGIGVFTLISNKQWKEAAEALIGYKETVDLVSAGINGLMNIPILNVFLAAWWPAYKAGAYAQISDYDTLIKEKLKAEETGEIAVETTPTGATIWIDDTQHKYPSNSTIDKLLPKKYTVRLELKGHIEYEEEVQVKEGEQTRVAHEFEEIPEEIGPKAGRLQWETVDEKTGAAIGASFYINDRLEKSYATSMAIDLKPKTYELRWTAVGYEDYEDTVPIEKDTTTVLKVEMTKLEEPPDEYPGVTCESLGYLPEPGTPAESYEEVSVRGLTCYKLKEITKGKLEISSDPEASVWILGVKEAEKTPVTLELEQGMYDVTLKAEGYTEETIRVYIMPGVVTVRAVTLKAEEELEVPRRVWRIDVNSLPSSAKILVNYAWTRKYTPDFVLLDPGEYLITLTKSGFKPWETPLTLEEFELE